jgi:transposase-like protein
MKRADINALEKTLFHLPVDLKQHLANQLLGQINAQAHTFLETASSHRLCPHCGGERLVKWGRSGGLQRYRCQSLTCHKTFNAVTRTSLARLHYHNKWFDYLRCMRDSLPLRASAARVGIDLKTAFRWRHRFLHASANANANALSGIIEVDETFFAESCCNIVKKLVTKVVTIQLTFYQRVLDRVFSQTPRISATLGALL